MNLPVAKGKTPTEQKMELIKKGEMLPRSIKAEWERKLAVEKSIASTTRAFNHAINTGQRRRATSPMDLDRYSGKQSIKGTVLYTH